MPKEQVEKVHELSPDAAQALGAALATVCGRVVQATGTDQYNVLVNNGKDSGQVPPSLILHSVSMVFCVSLCPFLCT